jgi:hypothetical protein
MNQPTKNETNMKNETTTAKLEKIMVNIKSTPEDRMTLKQISQSLSIAEGLQTLEQLQSLLFVVSREAQHCLVDGNSARASFASDVANDLKQQLAVRFA